MSKRGHVPLRMCTGCRQRRKKEEMVRLVQRPGGVTVLDGKQILPGRGIYLCPDPSCLRIARKKGRVERIVGLDGTWGSLDRHVSPSWDEEAPLEGTGISNGISYRRNRNGKS